MGGKFNGRRIDDPKIPRSPSAQKRYEVRKAAGQANRRYTLVPLLNAGVPKPPAAGQTGQTAQTQPQTQEERRAATKVRLNSAFKGIADQQHREQVSAAYQDAPEELTKCLEKHCGNVGYNVLPSTDNCWYSRMNLAIEIGSLAQATRDAEIDAKKFEVTSSAGILRHEMGHALDNRLAGGYDFISSIDKDFTAAFDKTADQLKEKDPDNPRRKIYKDKYLKWLGCRYETESASIWSSKAPKKKIVDWFWKEPTDDPNFRKFDGCSPVSDIFSALTKGKLEDGYNHKKTYWKSDENRRTEVFAHLTNLYAAPDKTIWNEMKREFPDLTKAYENIIKRAAQS